MQMSNTHCECYFCITVIFKVIIEKHFAKQLKCTPMFGHLLDSNIHVEAKYIYRDIRTIYIVNKYFELKKTC